MLDCLLPDRFDQDIYAALSAEIYRFINDNLGKINLGEVGKVLIEMASEKVWIIHLEKRVLVLTLSKKINLGSLKFKLASILSGLEFSE